MFNLFLIVVQPFLQNLCYITKINNWIDCCCFNSTLKHHNWAILLQSVFMGGESWSPRRKPQTFNRKTDNPVRLRLKLSAGFELYLSVDWLVITVVELLRPLGYWGLSRIVNKTPVQSLSQEISYCIIFLVTWAKIVKFIDYRWSSQWDCFSSLSPNGEHEKSNGVEMTNDNLFICTLPMMTLLISCQ